MEHKSLTHPPAPSAVIVILSDRMKPSRHCTPVCVSLYLYCTQNSGNNTTRAERAALHPTLNAEKLIHKAKKVKSDKPSSVQVNSIEQPDIKWLRIAQQSEEFTI